MLNSTSWQISMYVCRIIFFNQQAKLSLNVKVPLWCSTKPTNSWSVTLSLSCKSKHVDWVIYIAQLQYAWKALGPAQYVYYVLTLNVVRQLAWPQ